MALQRMPLSAYCEAIAERERVHRALAGIVGDVGDALGRADRGDRAHVDDGALALLLHDRQHVLGGEEEALHVDVEHQMPFVLAELDRAAGRADADIVVEHVDAAPFGHAGVDHRLDVGVLRGIGLERHRLAALPFPGRSGPTVSSAAARLRSTHITRAPSRAKVTAVHLPLPQPGPLEPAPTTIATLSFNLPAMSLTPFGVSLARAHYSAVCFLKAATSCAVICDTLLPKRAVT